MTSKTIPTRNEIQDNDKWDLSPLFKDEKEWESLFIEIESIIPGFENYKEKLSESLETFKSALDLDQEISRKVEKLYTYAHLKSDEDKTNQHYMGFYQRAMNLYTRISEATSFITPEIQSIDDSIMNNYKKEDSIKEYKFMLEQILRFKPHTLSKEVEQILAMSGEISSTASQVFSQLDNADLKFGEIKDDKGEGIELSHGNFNTFLNNPSPDVRKKAFLTYYKAYENHKNTIATTLSQTNKKDSFYSKVRNFQSSMESALFSDDVPIDVYENLIKTVKDNKEPLFKYLNFRKKALGLTELHFYDTYVPIINDVDFEMSYEEAVEICTKAAAPLGKEYCEIMKNGLLNGWVDRYENKGKRSGAYSSGCYDSSPYILLNYDKKNINSLYTLMHEAGHSMHSYYSAKNQPYITHDYTIFVAEVASTFNETLLSNYLLDLYKDNKKMKTYITNREIDNIRGTLFRQTMFAEFEKLSHDEIEKNNPLTLDTMRNIYKNLLVEYFGDTIIIDEELTLECLRIPHFYSAFYVYKYATGISAAIALAKNVMENGDSARDKYLDFLKLGGTMFPIDELKEAGVDMTTSEPIQNAITHFESMVNKLIEEY